MTLPQIITKDEIRAQAPAAFAQEPAFNVSDRYSFISTERVIDALAEQGWFPVTAQQSKNRRIKDPGHFTHAVTFRQPQVEIALNGVCPEVVLLNDHRGRRPAELLAGFLRLICLNGLMVNTGIGNTELVRVHKGEAELDVFATLLVAQQTLKTAEAEIRDWQSIELSLQEQIAFARNALALRTEKPAINVEALLERRRAEDLSSDLWTVFNVVQEHLSQGGVSRSLFGRRGVRRITGVTASQKFNQSLWALAQSVGARIKSAFGR
jgi:hypothetical protein